MVALRKESVDRNNFSRLHYNITVMVALRKESVDRNLACRHFVDLGQVALRKESVDRNAGGLLGCDSLLASLSARRAWIEIQPAGVCVCCRQVALRKESVDRNCKSAAISF